MNLVLNASVTKYTASCDELEYYIIHIIYSIIFVLSFVHKLYIWNGVVESHQIRVRTPSSRLLAAERLGSPYSASICACDNRANCSVCAQTARGKKKGNYSLWKLLCFFLLNYQWFLSVLFDSCPFFFGPACPDVLILVTLKWCFPVKSAFCKHQTQTWSPGVGWWGGGWCIQRPKKVETVAFHCQRMVCCFFPPVTEI